MILKIKILRDQLLENNQKNNELQIYNFYQILIKTLSRNHHDNKGLMDLWRQLACKF